MRGFRVRMDVVHSAHTHSRSQLTAGRVGKCSQTMLRERIHVGSRLIPSHPPSSLCYSSEETLDSLVTRKCMFHHWIGKIKHEGYQLLNSRKCHPLRILPPASPSPLVQFFYLLCLPFIMSSLFGMPTAQGYLSITIMDLWCPQQCLTVADPQGGFAERKG